MATKLPAHVAKHSALYSVLTYELVSEPVADAEDKARDTTDSLPPITKETTATAEASLVPSAPAESTTTGAPAAATPVVPAPAIKAQEDSADELSKPDAVALQPENPSDTAPASVPQSATAETIASDVESSASAGPGEAVEPPKPVSLEEIRDQELPDAKPSKLTKPAEEKPKTDTSSPAQNGHVATNNKRKADTAGDVAKPEAHSVENENIEPAAKKQKTNGTTNGVARKPGRPRKDKNAVKVVGRTARKTRSQGAAD